MRERNMAAMKAAKREKQQILLEMARRGMEMPSDRRNSSHTFSAKYVDGQLAETWYNCNRIDRDKANREFLMKINRIMVFGDDSTPT